MRVVICGAGLHGSALAYYLTLLARRAGTDVKVTVVEREGVASAASGKGGGFLARDWGSRETQALHEVSFALHAELAEELGITSYRRIPVLSVTPGERTARTHQHAPWLDGDISDSQIMDADGGAQVSPKELCSKLMDAAIEQGAKLVIGCVEGIRKSAVGENGLETISGLIVDGSVIEAEACVITMGPWSSIAQEWLDMVIPIAGLKSTSVIFQSKEEVEPYALFCGEDPRFGTHLEVYPRAEGQLYVCGVGGSEEVSPERLRAGEYPPGQVEADPSRVSAATVAFQTMSKRLAADATTPATTQACMRPCPPDAMPMMGKVPHVRNAYISAGHNCWGILWAPVSGKAMAELILDGKASCVDLSAFHPGRFMQSRKSGGRGRKRGAQPVGEQW